MSNEKLFITAMIAFTNADIFYQKQIIEGSSSNVNPSGLFKTCNIML